MPTDPIKERDRVGTPSQEENGIMSPEFRKWGTLSAQVGHDGADVIIAATALHHGLTVVTRERHFAPLSVPLSNPFDEA